MESKSGFGTSEFLTVALICLVLSFILLSVALNVRSDEKYTVFAYNAKVLGTNAVHYQMSQGKEGTVYLYHLVDIGFLTEIKNPFPKEEFCNAFESKVVFEEDEKHIYLRCGDYLIKNQLLGDRDIAIYQVSDWQEKREDKKQAETVLYNYQVKKKEVFESFLEEEVFLDFFNKKNKTTYEKVSDIPSSYQVKSKTVYRDETLVKKIKY